MAEIGKPVRRIKSVPEKPSIPAPEPKREVPAPAPKEPEKVPA